MSKSRGGRPQQVDLSKMKEGLPPGPPPAVATKKFVFRPVATIVSQKDEVADKQFAENKAAIEAGIGEYIVELRRLQEATMASPDNFVLIAQLEAIEGAIKDVFNRASQPAEGGSRALGLVAILAFAQNLVATCWTEKYWVIDLINRLKKIHFLEEVEKGSEILGRYYSLTEDFQKISGAQKALRDLQQVGITASEVARDNFESALAELKARAGETPLSIAELKAGKSGRSLIYLPSKEKEEDGKTKHFAGGHLLIESDGAVVRLLAVVGGVSRYAEELISGGTTVRVSHLGQQPPSTLPTLVQKLAYWLRDSIVHAEAEAAKTAEVAKWATTEAEEVAWLTSKATSLISAEDFILRQASGQLVVRFGSDRTFAQKSKGADGKEVTNSYHALSALIERRVDGAIRLVACPDRLKPLFAGCADYTQPEENFKGICIPLAVCLRAEFGRAQKAAAEKAEKKAAVQAAAPAVKAEAAATAAAMLAVREQAAVEEEQPASPATASEPAPPPPPEPSPEPIPTPVPVAPTPLPVPVAPAPAPVVVTEDEVWALIAQDGHPVALRQAYQACLGVLSSGGQLAPLAAEKFQRLQALIAETKGRLEAAAPPDPFAGLEF